MLDITAWVVFLLVLVRVTAFLVASPVFAMRNIPNSVKIGFGCILALVLTPQLLKQQVVLPEHFIKIIGMVINETIAGLIAGLGASMLMTAIQVAGQYLDLQAGFAMAQVFDPARGINNTLIGQFLYILGLILFFSTDAHHSLIFALAKSFEILELGSFHVSGGLFLKLLQIFLTMFTYALRIAIPVILVLVIIDLSLGYMTRIVPQLNIFMSGFPLKIGFGLLMLALLVPVVGSVVGSLFQTVEKELMQIFGGL